MSVLSLSPFLPLPMHASKGVGCRGGACGAAGEGSPGRVEAQPINSIAY
jgi:hypothetical protein